MVGPHAVPVLKGDPSGSRTRSRDGSFAETKYRGRRVDAQAALGGGTVEQGSNSRVRGKVLTGVARHDFHRDKRQLRQRRCPSAPRSGAAVPSSSPWPPGSGTGRIGRSGEADTREVSGRRPARPCRGGSHGTGARAHPAGVLISALRPFLIPHVLSCCPVRRFYSLRMLWSFRLLYRTSLFLSPTAGRRDEYRGESQEDS